MFHRARPTLAKLPRIYVLGASVDIVEPDAVSGIGQRQGERLLDGYSARGFSCARAPLLFTRLEHLFLSGLYKSQNCKANPIFPYNSANWFDFYFDAIVLVC
jgi:hypothetical protein